MPILNLTSLNPCQPQTDAIPSLAASLWLKFDVEMDYLLVDQEQKNSQDQDYGQGFYFVHTWLPIHLQDRSH